MLVGEFDPEIIRRKVGLSGWNGEPRRSFSHLIDKRGGVTIDECEAVSRRIDPILEEAGLMADVDTFEVSSPGLDRPLKKPADFVRHMGEKVDVGLYKAIDGDKTITGTLTDYDDGGLTLETADGPVKLEKGEIAVVKQHLDF